MRYEVIMKLKETILFNVEADSKEEAIQLVKDTKPIWHKAHFEVTSLEATAEPIL